MEQSVKLPGSCNRAGDLAAGPFGCTPVHDLPLADQVGHGSDDLFQRGIRVETMAEVQIDIIRVQPLEGGMDGIHDVLA